MFHPMSHQLYRYEHGLSPAEQRGADVRAGEAAAALRDLRLGLGRAVRLGRRGRPARRAADAMTAPVQVLSSVR
jgi:hypothetical protein